jgi:hypothetical protein
VFFFLYIKFLFYFLKIIFIINTSKKFKNIKKILILKNNLNFKYFHDTKINGRNLHAIKDFAAFLTASPCPVNSSIQHPSLGFGPDQIEG